MSSRALRKIRCEKGLDHIKSILQDAENDIQSNTDEDKIYPKKKINMFDLLNVEESCHVGEQEATEETIEPMQSTKQKKKKKKKKKTQHKEVSDDENIDQILSELNIQTSDRLQSHESGLLKNDKCSNQSILTVFRKHLNAENELRRLFGGHISNNEARSRGTQFRRKANILTTPKNTWPPMTKCGIQMLVDRTEAGVTYFKYTHSKTNYQNLQQMFWKASRLADPHAVKHILEIHPYHIDTLLHLSEVCRVSEDTQTASDLLERALYCLEVAFHPNFNVTSLNCRLDFNRTENRAFFIAIFRHILFICQKSCWQTAFELTKLLYNISPDQDPFACLLFIDIFALKVENYKFVLSFIDEFEHSKRLLMLPNFAYSYALAQFYKEIVDGMNHQKSTDILCDAILKFPMVAKLICDSCTHIIDSNILYVMNNDILQSHTRSLTQQCKLYTERALDLWKDAEIIPWFKKCTDFVNNHFSSMDNFEQSKEVRKNIKSPPLNVMRHIFVSDISSVSVLLPNTAFESSHDPHDPMPPPISVSDYQPEITHSHHQNPILAFINSLMPNYNQNPHQIEDHLQNIQGIELGGFLQPGDDGVQQGGWGENLRNIPGDFGQAVRDLLQNIQGLNNEAPLPEVIDEAASSEHDVPEDELD